MKKIIIAVALYSAFALVIAASCAPAGGLAVTPGPTPAAEAGTQPATPALPGYESQPRLILSRSQLITESTDIFIGTISHPLEEMVNTSFASVGVPHPDVISLHRQYEIQVQQCLKGDAKGSVNLIMEEVKTLARWESPARGEYWQEYLPEVSPVLPAIGKKYVFFASRSEAFFPGRLIGYRHPSRFMLQGGTATVEDEYFVSGNRDKYYPSKPEAEFLAEVQDAVVRNPTNIPDLVGSPGYKGT